MRNINLTENFHLLEWDSEFFGFKVAKIDNFKLTIENRADFNGELVKNNIKLAYYFTDTPLEHPSHSENYQFLLVDKKVPLVKKLGNKNFHPKVSFYNETQPSKELIRLAQQAGIHTRFNVDPNIPQHKYEELFEIWIEKSVTKERATDVLVYKEGNKIVGFASIQLKDEKPYVSLLAVQKEYEGKGVSFALMNSIENILSSRGYLEVFGATQLDNRKAMIVYQRYGLLPQPTEYVYHIWKK